MKSFKRLVCILLVALLALSGGVPFISGGIAAAAQSTISRIAAGSNHSLALFSNGDLYAWGSNQYGQLGDGTKETRMEPTKIGTGYTRIAAGNGYTLALKGDALYAWGNNQSGQLGDGTGVDKRSPVQIGSGYSQIAAGEKHALAIKGNTLYAWGDNQSGQLGDGTTVSRSAPVAIGSGYTRVAAGNNHSLALKNTTLYAWGNNLHGQLGDGTTTAKHAPLEIGSGYTQIAAGASFSLALQGGTLYAWGRNGVNQLGDRSTVNKSKPTEIGGGYSLIEAGSGQGHSMAVKDSALYSWGWNYGLAGDGTSANKSEPTKIDTGYTQIAAGAAHNLAIKGGALYAWGTNSSAQLGDGTRQDRSKPVKIQFLALPTGLTLNQTKMDLAKGGTITLKTTINPSDVTDTLTWTSSNANIATVSKGVITAKAYGVVTITAATSNGITAKCAVTVVPRKVAQKTPTVSGSKVKLSWNAIADVAGYKIAYQKGSGDFGTLTDITSASKNSFTTANLAKGTYSFKIRAYTKINGALKYGNYSDTLTVTIK